MPITHGAGKYLSSGTLISHHMFQIKQISEVLFNAKLLRFLLTLVIIKETNKTGRDYRTFYVLKS